MMTHFLPYDGATTVLETDLYAYRQNKVEDYMYNYNYLIFKKIPTVEAFQEAIKAIQPYRLNEAIKAKFPLDAVLSRELGEYCMLTGFDFGSNTLMKINPLDFKQKVHPQIDVAEVTKETLAAFCALQWEENLLFGESFAQHKQANAKKILHDPQFHQILAMKDGVAVGSLELINHGDYREIDNFYVEKQHRKNGIGSAIQSYVMQQYADKPIILVADAEDTPKNMYAKQGYEEIGTWIEVQYIESEDTKK